MSMQILEYPIKKWVINLIDDPETKSKIFDLLGHPNIDIRYPSVMLYSIDNLVEHEKHSLVLSIDAVAKSDEYKLDLGEFASCNVITNQVIGILRDADAVLKKILSTVDKIYVKLFELDKLSVSLTNGLRLTLNYSGADIDKKKKVESLDDYVFKSEIIYDEETSDNEEADNELKDVLDEIVRENLHRL